MAALPSNTNIPQGYHLALPQDKQNNSALFINDLWVKPGADSLRLDLPKKARTPIVVNEGSQPLPMETEVQSSVLDQQIQRREKGLQQQAIAGSALPGLSAPAGQVPTGDATSAVWQAIGSGLSGAAGGAFVGAKAGSIFGLPGAAGGAAIGGLAGLVVGGITAYTGLRAKRQARRDANRQAKKIMDMQRKALAQQRADVNEQLRYNRRINALQSKWDAMESARGHLNELIAGNHKLKSIFLKMGR